jgi:hypothetical protein
MQTEDMAGRGACEREGREKTLKSNREWHRDHLFLYQEKVAMGIPQEKVKG